MWTAAAAVGFALVVAAERTSQAHSEGWVQAAMDTRIAVAAARILQIQHQLAGIGAVELAAD